jgi:hypothetical protein
MHGLSFPSFILDVEDLHPRAARPADVLTQLLSEESEIPFREYLRRLSVRPAFIWDHVIEQRVGGLTYPELRQLTEWSDFNRLNADLATRVLERRARFERLEGLVERIRQERLDQQTRARRLTLGRGDPSYKTANRFIEVFSITLLDQRSRLDPAAAIGGALTESFLTIRRQWPRLDTAEFLLIARKMIEMNLAGADVDVAVATLKTLVIISRDFDVTRAEAQDLLDLVRLFSVKDRQSGRVVDLDQQSGAAVFMKAERWGKPDVASTAVVASALPGLIAEVRRELPDRESAELTDAQLIDRVVRGAAATSPWGAAAAPAEEPPLQFWNPGIIN